MHTTRPVLTLQHRQHNLAAALKKTGMAACEAHPAAEAEGGEGASGGESSWIDWLLLLDPPARGDREDAVQETIEESTVVGGTGPFFSPEEGGFGVSMEELTADLNGDFLPLEMLYSRRLGRGVAGVVRGAAGGAGVYGAGDGGVGVGEAGVVAAGASWQGCTSQGLAMARAACARRGEVVWEACDGMGGGGRGGGGGGGRLALASLIRCWVAACRQTMM